MKSVPNATFALKNDGENATVASLLTLCLNNAPLGGFDFATMRARNRVAVVLEALEDGDTIDLEDADHKTAVEAVRQMKWGVAHPDMLKFAELFGL